jgi:hypothetical protein
MVSCAAPRWASVVRDRVQPRPSPPISPPILLSTSTAAVTRDEFLALYKQCVASGLKARFAIRHDAGLQEASLTCLLSPPFSTINPPTTKRRRCRMLATTDATGLDAPPPAYVAMPSDPLPIHSALSTAPPRPLSLPVVPTDPPPAPISSPTLETFPPASPPPAERTRKAAKRRCKVELLQEEGYDGEMELSPLSCTPLPPPSASPLTPPCPPST